MSLDKIYQPVRNELSQIDSLLNKSLRATSNKPILEINRYLLDSPGKRIRPALVVLSAHASNTDRKKEINQEQLVAIGAAVELIHMASLIHDDTIDHANMRHNKPSINAKWGQEISIALGDYLYSKAFELIANCQNTEVLTCLSQAMAQMCEGELIQVKERGNLKLNKRQYLVVIKKKTASFMASCCRAGAASVKGKFIYKQALTNYGLNFGIAFQVKDDYLDLTATNEELGKPACLDLSIGELTLPFLSLPFSKRKKLLEIKKTKEGIELIKQVLEKLGLFNHTRNFVENYILRAKENLNQCLDSEYRDSLENLADYISQKA